MLRLLGVRSCGDQWVWALAVPAAKLLQSGALSFSNGAMAMNDVTRILSQVELGDAAAAEQLLPVVYDELRKLIQMFNGRNVYCPEQASACLLKLHRGVELEPCPTRRLIS